jgi:Collagen triple helix repeat (20 copies)
MPQSFKNAWRWLVGASAAAMLIASIAPAANAQVPDTGKISICVSRAGKITGINIPCRNHNFKLIWNIPGPQGDAGLQGNVGPAGAPGAVGPTGSQGDVGPVGPTGPMGALGLTGPAGVQGVTGPAGPTGDLGHPGPTGPTGLMGPSGTPAPFTGDNVEILSGGTLGGTIGGAAQIQLTQFSGDFTPPIPTTPLYLGPGNGASGEGVFSPDSPPAPVAAPQTSVQVPTPGGTAFNMTVSIAPGDAGPSGSDYTFILCNEANCDIMTNPFCRVANDPFPSGDSTVCSTNTFVGSALSLDYLPGDTLSIQAFRGEAAIATNTVDVRWSLDYAIAKPDAF